MEVQDRAGNNLWGRLSAPAQVALPAAPAMTKQSVRQRVWEFLERNDVAAFPRPVYNRIPNFRGAAAAGAAIADIQEFEEARVVMVGKTKTWFFFLF